ncbi:MAG TPA: hypothetical protein VKR58_15405, partial [Aquella sp.]|nr:hypothetical protein [Aquella sp.]
DKFMPIYVCDEVGPYNLPTSAYYAPARSDSGDENLNPKVKPRPSGKGMGSNSYSVQGMVYRCTPTSDEQLLVVMEDQ